MTRIRDSRAGEATALKALQLRAANVWEEYRELLAEHPDAIAIPDGWIDEGRIRVAVDDEDRPVGFAVVLAEELDGLFVDPSAARAGVGRDLVEDAAERARDAGLHELRVTAHRIAVPFYERVGFVATGPAETRFGPGIRMRLGLT